MPKPAVGKSAPTKGQHSYEWDFPDCDGYSAPRGKSDGISRETFLWGAASRSVDVRRDKMERLGERGLEACDRALASPLLLDDFWLRRASLLQAKAVHALATKQHDLAITLADHSDALGIARKDPYFMQSVGAGNIAIRSYALGALGRNDEAVMAIGSIENARPWAMSVTELALRLRFHLNTGTAENSSDLKRILPHMPHKAESLFWLQFVHGRYDEALQTAPAVEFGTPKQRGGWTLEGADHDELERIGRRADFVGAWAYAESISGNNERAVALIAHETTNLDTMMAPPPPRANGKPARREDVAAHTLALPRASRAKDQLSLWRKAIDFRPKLATLAVDDPQVELVQSWLTKLPILPDILRTMPLTDPRDKAEADQALADYFKRLESDRSAELVFGESELMELLPRPETAKVVPVLKPAGDGYFLSDSGLSRSREGTSDVWTIRYTHKLAPVAAVEELAMLGAAQTARREGFDSMIILNRLSIARTTNVTNYYYGVAGPTYPVNSGYEAQLRVRFVNANALPPAMAAMGWRTIAVQKLIDDLNNRYKSGGVTIAW